MTYDSTILAEGTIKAYYALNETSGTTATDSTANAYNGTMHGTITLNQTAIAAGLDPCMLLNGSTGYISLPTGPNVAEPFSIEMWVKSNGAISSDQYWFSNNIPNGMGFGWNHTGGDKIHVYAAGGSYDTSNTLSASITYYVALTVDGSSNYVIFAGKVGTDSAPSQWGTGNPGAGPTYSGGSDIGAEATTNVLLWGGYVSSVAIYTSVLTGTQMNTHYTSGTTAPGGGPAPASTLGLMGVG